MKNPPKKLTVCPNCQTELENLEPFCPTCGQKNQDILLPLKAHLADLFESIFNWDSRFFRTLKVMFFNPGKLTVDFNEGKRKSYVPPLRMYLVSSILFFLLFNMASENAVRDVDNSLEDTIGAITDTVDINLGTTGMLLTGPEVLEVKKMNDTQLDSLLISKGAKPGLFNRISVRQTLRVMTGGMSEYYAQFMQAASVGMFVLMPVFAGLLMLFFRKPKRFYVEHLVLSVHLHTLAFLLFSVNILTQQIGFLSFLDYVFPYLAVILIILYLKKFYRKSWLKTIGLSLLLAISYTILFTISLGVIGLISLFIY